MDSISVREIENLPCLSSELEHLPKVVLKNFSDANEESSELKSTDNSERLLPK